MLNIGSLLIDSLDYIMIVDKDYNIIYNTRYDTTIGDALAESKRSEYIYKNFFDVYPNIKKEESNIVRCIESGEVIIRKAQKYEDYLGQVYITNNVTLPLKRKGELIAAVEITLDMDFQAKDKELAELRFDQFVKRIREASGQITFDTVLTENDEFKRSIEKAKALAAMPNPTLIYGETGTGKEVFAQAMIDYSGVPKNNVVIQNCAAVPETLIESILFGTVKGVYTGAENHKGLFEIADGGIIFLDELNSIPFHVQAKLLRVLQDGTFRPLGSNKDKKVKVKVIAAMNIDPMTAIERNILRKDLFYRFSGGLITLSPLRERPEDIELFTRYYIKYFSDIYDKEPKDIDDKLMNAFMSYAWEGNVRELMNAIEFMVTSSQGENILTAQMLPVYLREKITAQFPGLRDGSTYKYDSSHEDDSSQDRKADFYLEHGSYHRLMDDFEKNMIEEALYQSGGNKSEAARLLGIPRQTLKYRMKILQIK